MQSVFRVSVYGCKVWDGVFMFNEEEKPMGGGYLMWIMKGRGDLI